MRYSLPFSSFMKSSTILDRRILYIFMMKQINYVATFSYSTKRSLLVISEMTTLSQSNGDTMVRSSNGTPSSGLDGCTSAIATSSSRILYQFYKWQITLCFDSFIDGSQYTYLLKDAFPPQEKMNYYPIQPYCMQSEIFS